MSSSVRRSGIKTYARYLNTLAGATQVFPTTGSFDLLETTILNTTTGSVSFSNLGTYASIYQHLQVRVVSRDNRSTTGGNNVRVTLNGDSSSNYASHRLRGDGSSGSTLSLSSAASMNLFASSSLNDATSAYGVAILDILDPFEAKNKAFKVLQGNALASNTSAVEVRSGLWMSTASLSSITFTPETTGSFISGSRFSLYGVK